MNGYQEPSEDFPFDEVFRALDGDPPDAIQAGMDKFERVLEWIAGGRTAQACIVRLHAVRKFYCADSAATLAKQADVGRRRMTLAIEEAALEFGVKAPRQWPTESRAIFKSKLPANRPPIFKGRASP